jgi:hypothetical protein
MAVWRPVDFDDILTQQDNSQKNDPNEVLVISSDSEREENNVHRKGKNLKPGSVEMILKCHETLVSEIIARLFCEQQNCCKYLGKP